MSDLKKRIYKLSSSLIFRSRLFKSMQQRGPKWRILLYHRIADPEKLPARVPKHMYVRPKTFREHLHYLKENCNVISVNELIQYLLTDKEVPPQTVCITFDDGWGDNYSTAFPLLTEFGLPATIFLITGYVATNEIYWVDKLSLALSQSQLKRFSDLDFAYVQSLEGVLDPATYAALFDAFNTTAKADEIELLEKLSAILMRIPPLPRAQIISRLVRVVPPRMLNNFPRSFLDWREIDEMARAGINFGSHTHTHQILPELDSRQISEELVASYEALRSHGIRPCEAFAYPFGSFNSYTQERLAQAGIRFALTSLGTADPTKNPVLLNRVPIYESVSSTVPLFATRIWSS